MADYLMVFVFYLPDTGYRKPIDLRLARYLSVCLGGVR
jgi:hypothetical protein